MRKQKIVYLFTAGLIAFFEYVWGLWYYGGLYQSGELLSSATVSSVTLPVTLMQHMLVNLPVWTVLIVCFVTLRGGAFSVLGFVRPVGRKGVLTILAAAAYLFLLLIALNQGKNDSFSILYQWVYYFLFVALTEEAVFRGLMPWLMKKSELPEWCVWIVPGVLFGLMHTTLPLIRNGLGVDFIRTLSSGIGGYTLGACGFYFLRRWSGSLWFPILVHAALDFIGVLF